MKLDRQKLVIDFLFLLGLTILILLCITNILSEETQDESEDIPTETVNLYAPISEKSHFATFTDPQSDRNMDYHIYFPENATQHMPLVVYLHGTGAIGHPDLNADNPAIVKTLEFYGDEFPYILLAPSSMYNRSWRQKHIPALVKALVDDIVLKYKIDREKIIIIGHSMGAGGVFRQIELYGDFYSAAVPVSLTNTDNIDILSCVDVPIWGFAGTEESPHEYNMRKFFDKIEESGGNVRFSALEGAEHGNSADFAFSKQVFDWALAQ